MSATKADVTRAKRDVCFYPSSRNRPGNYRVFAPEHVAVSTALNISNDCTPT